MAASTTRTIIVHRSTWPRLATTPPRTAAVSPGITNPMNKASSANTSSPTMVNARTGLTFRMLSTNALTRHRFPGHEDLGPRSGSARLPDPGSRPAPRVCANRKKSGLQRVSTLARSGRVSTGHFQSGLRTLRWTRSAQRCCSQRPVPAHLRSRGAQSAGACAVDL